MTDLERAMADVAFIQQRLAESTRFDGLAPHAVAATGLLALIAAWSQASWPILLNGDPLDYVGFWSAIAFAAAAMIGGEALTRARRLHGSMADRLIASTLRLLLPFIGAGAVLAVVMLRFAPANIWMLPGLWQMLIALAGFSAVPVLPRSIVWPAGWYFACAFTTLAIGAQQESAGAWMMGLPFGIGQLLVALTLHRAARGAA